MRARSRKSKLHDEGRRALKKRGRARKTNLHGERRNNGWMNAKSLQQDREDLGSTFKFSQT